MYFAPSRPAVFTPAYRLVALGCCSSERERSYSSDRLPRPCRDRAILRPSNRRWVGAPAAAATLPVLIDDSQALSRRYARLQTHRLCDRSQDRPRHVCTRMRRRSRRVCRSLSSTTEDCRPPEDRSDNTLDLRRDSSRPEPERSMRWKGRAERPSGPSRSIAFGRQSPASGRAAEPDRIPGTERRRPDRMTCSLERATRSPSRPNTRPMRRWPTASALE